MDIEQILNADEHFRYQLLDRMRTDCLYYLNCGNRMKKYLWALDEDVHIAYMKAIWNSLSDKPEWLSFEDICDFERAMCGMREVH